MTKKKKCYLCSNQYKKSIRGKFCPECNPMIDKLLLGEIIAFEDRDGIVWSIDSIDRGINNEKEENVN